MDQETNLIVKISGEQAKAVAEALAAALSKLEKSGDKAAEAVEKTGEAAEEAASSQKELADETEKSARQMDRLTGIMSVFGTVIGSMISTTFGMINALTQAGQQYMMLEARVGLYTKSAREADDVMRTLSLNANRNGASLNGAVEAFSQMAVVMGELKTSAGGLAELVGVVQSIGRLSGSGTQQMNSAMLQFTQMLTTGKVRAQELNIIMMSLPRLAVAMADGMNMTVGEFRNAVMEGRVLSDQVLRGLLSQQEQLAAEAAKMPLQWSQSWQVFINEFMRAGKAFEEMFGLAKMVGGMLEGVGKAFAEITPAHIYKAVEAMKGLAGAVGALVAAGFAVWLYSSIPAITAFVTSLYSIVTALTAVEAGMIALKAASSLALGAIGLAVTVLIGTIGYFIATHKSAAEQLKETKIETDSATEAFERLAAGIDKASSAELRLYEVKGKGALYQIGTEQRDNDARRTEVNRLITYHEGVSARSARGEIDLSPEGLQANRDALSKLKTEEAELLLRKEELNKESARQVELLGQVRDRLATVSSEENQSAEITKKFAAERHALAQAFADGMPEAEFWQQWDALRKQEEAALKTTNDLTEGTKKLTVEQARLQARQNSFASEAKDLYEKLNGGKIGAAEYRKEMIELEAKYDDLIPGIQRTTQEMENQTRAAERAAEENKKLLLSVGNLDAMSAEFKEKAAKLANALGGTGTEEYRLAIEELMRTMPKLFPYMAELSKKAKDNERDMDSATEANQKYVEGMKRQLAELGMTPFQLSESRALEGLNPQGKNYAEQVVQVKELNRLQYERAALIDAEKAKAEEYKRAWQEALNRVDASFAQVWDSAFKGTLDGFDDFADSLKDAFLSLLGELAHMAITKPIVLSVASTFGIGGQGQLGAGGTATAGSAFDGISKAVSGINSVYGWLTGKSMTSSALGASGVQAGLAGFGMKSGMLVEGFQPGKGLFASGDLPGYNINWKGVAANAAAGYAGQYAASQLYQGRESSGFGSTAGGMVGSYWGPWGAAAGSFVGEMLDRALSGSDFSGKRVKLGIGTGGLGTNEWGEDARVLSSGLRVANLTRRVDDAGMSDEDAQAYLGAFDTLDAALMELSTALGAKVDLSNTTLPGMPQAYDGGISGGGFFGTLAKGELRDLMNDAPAMFVKQWLEAASEAFDENMRGYIKKLSGTAEEMIGKMGALADVSQQMELFTGAIKTMGEVLNSQSAKTLVSMPDKSVFQQWTDAGRDIIKIASDLAKYDSGELTNAVAKRYELEMAYLGQIRDALAGTRDVFTGTIEGMKMDLMGSDAERVDYLGGQAQYLAKVATTVNDPTTIMKSLSMLDQIAGQMYGLAGSGDQAAFAREMIPWLEAVRDAATERLNDLADDVDDQREEGYTIASVIAAAVREQEAVFLAEMEKIATSTANTAQVLDQAANTFNNSANTLANWNPYNFNWSQFNLEVNA